MRHRLAWFMLFAIAAFFLTAPLAVSAQTAAVGPVSLLAIDENANFDPISWDLAYTVSTVWADSTSKQEGPEALISFGLQRGAIQELESGESRASIARYFGMAGRSDTRSESDFFGALADGYSYFLDTNAPIGSRVFALSSGYFLGDAQTANFQDLAAAFIEKGWMVDIASLPGSPAPAREIFLSFSQMSGGSYFDLGTSAGITSFFQNSSPGASVPLIDLTITSGSAAVAVPIAPYADSSTLTLYRSSPDTNVSLYRPDGSIALHDATGLEIVEAPNGVMLHLKTPAPGDWIVITEGTGNVTLFESESNPLRLSLTDNNIVDASKSYSITAAPFVNGVIQPVENAWIEARITDSGQTRVVYELRDNGIGGDKVAGDGIFTGTAPSLNAAGVLNAELIMRWDTYRRTIASTDSFESKFFPTISLTEIDLTEETATDRFEVVANVTRESSDYLVPVDAVSAGLVDSNGTGASVSVSPVDPRDGQASQFVISGQRSSESATSLQVTIEGLPEFRAAIDANVNVVSYTPPETSVFADLITLPEWAQIDIPYWIWVAIVPVVMALILLVMWMFRRTRPFGYIYDDLDAVVVDFNNLKRGFFRTAFHPDSVDASELGLEGLRLKGGVFKFKNAHVELHYKSTSERESPVLRANGRPAGEVVKLSPSVVLGIGGRLLTFSEEKKEPPTFEEPTEVPFRSTYRSAQFLSKGS